MKEIEVVKRLQQKGFKAFFVGGCVRDMLMGLNPKDIDIVTSANPDEIIDIFKDQNVKEVGKNFGVILVNDIEVATFRLDKYFGGSDKNCEITFVKSLEEDVQRRDLTCNGLALDPITNIIYDYVNGQEDIKNKIIRFIGNSHHRIIEDPNRIIRACRFNAKIDGNFESDTFENLCKYSDYIESLVAPERIRLEILKAMEIKKASIFFRNLYEIDGLKYIFPSLNKAYLHPGGPYHIEDVFDHCMMAGDHIQTKYPLIKLAGYLHDIGKPISCRINPGTNDIWFEGHEETGAKASSEELLNLRFSIDESKYISNLVGLHMRINHERLGPKGVRRTLRALSEAGITYKELLRVSIGDKMGGLKSQKTYRIGEVKTLAKSFRDEINRKPTTKYSDLKVNGNDIMDITGLKPGKQIRVILDYLMDQTLENPELNNIEDLTKLIKEKNNEPETC
jgi:tRNA nucleotidyltransferase/poly(A) polymerase